MKQRFLSLLNNPWFVFVLAFALRLAFSLHRQDPFSTGGDGVANTTAAQHIWQTGSLIVDRPSVFPLFLCVTYFWTGLSILPALVAQSFLSALGVPLVRKLAEECGTPAAGPWAGWWVALDPFLIYFSSVFLTETLFIFLFLCGLFGLFRGWSKRSFSAAFVGGLFLALAGLCRNILIPFIPLIAAVFILSVWRAGRSFWAAGIGLCLGLILLLGGWVAYVHQQTGQWRIAAPQSGWTLYEGLNPDFEHPNAITQWQTAMEEEARSQGIAGDPAKKAAYFMEKSKATIRDNPGRFVGLMARKYLKFWRLVPYGDYYSRFQMAVSGLFFTPLFLLALFGAWNRLRNPNTLSWNLAFVIGFIVLYSLFNTIPWTQIRYRIPLHPLLSLLAGIAVVDLLHRKQGNA